MEHRPIHERVKEHVEAAGLTYGEIAKKTKWSEQKVARLMTGKTQLHAEHIETLADLLKKSVADLYRGLPKSRRRAS